MYTIRYSPLCGLTSNSCGGLWPLANSFLAFGQCIFGLRPNLSLPSANFFLGLRPRPCVMYSASYKSSPKRHLKVQKVPKGPRGT